RVLDLDAVEIELGRQPADPVHRPPAANPLGPPEGMRGKRDAPLFVDGVHGGRGGQSWTDALAQEQADYVPVAAGNLLPDDDMGAPVAGGVVGGTQGSLDGVVVGDGDDVE